MTAAPQAGTSSEPLLWLHLLVPAVLPLEALLLLLLLAGADPGPLVGLERLLCWALGALAPAVVLWRRPADVWSLLLVQTPVRGRRDLQRRLSSLQEAWPPRIGLALGCAGALPLLWWLDGHAGLAMGFSPVQEAPRMLVLLLAALLLALMVWQWQQLLQAIWLLGRPGTAVDAADAMDNASLEARRLSLGLPLLLPAPLQPAENTAPSAGSALAVEPEEPATDGQGRDLDEQVGGGDIPAG
jgi:hypothetical protein